MAGPEVQPQHAPKLRPGEDGSIGGVNNVDVPAAGAGDLQLARRRALIVCRGIVHGAAVAIVQHQVAVLSKNTHWPVQHRSPGQAVCADLQQCQLCPTEQLCCGNSPIPA